MLILIIVFQTSQFCLRPCTNNQTTIVINVILYLTNNFFKEEKIKYFRKKPHEAPRGQPESDFVSESDFVRLKQERCVRLTNARRI